MISDPQRPWSRGPRSNGSETSSVQAVKMIGSDGVPSAMILPPRSTVKVATEPGGRPVMPLMIVPGRIVNVTPSGIHVGPWSTYTLSLVHVCVVRSPIGTKTSVLPGSLMHCPNAAADKISTTTIVSRNSRCTGYLLQSLRVLVCYCVSKRVKSGDAVRIETFVFLL